VLPATPTHKQIMSYDLYFYKSKGTSLSENQIAGYLTNNLVSVNKESNQWYYQNKDTEVYYLFDQNKPDDEPESIELYESFKDFDTTHFSFNLNFIRPGFFGLQAFQFIEQFINDLNLYVLNPQSASDNPYKPTKKELFDNWNKTNLHSGSDHFDSLQSGYLPAEKSNEIWNYNFHRSRLQNELGEKYFVPKIFFFKKRQTNEVITVTSWTEHIPTVIAPADYFLLSRKHQKFFRTVKDNILVSRKRIMETLGLYFDDFSFKECKIIHPENAHKIKNIFNLLKAEYTLADFAERLPIELLFNAKPGN